MSDPAAVKRALARLATNPEPPNYRRVTSAAIDAIENLECSPSFLETHGLETLEEAVETAVECGDVTAAQDGRRALTQFTEFRTVARGQNHFQPAHGIPLREQSKAGRT